MTDSDNIVAAMAERIFADLADPRAIAHGKSPDWKAPLWQALAVPLAETMLAGWLLARAGIASPHGAMTVAPARPKDRIALNDDGTLSGTARGVPFAGEAKHIAVVATGARGAAIALVDASACRIAAGLNLAGDASDSVTFDKARPLAIKPAPAGFDVTALLLMGGVARSLQIAGALEAMLEISVAYANERVAFEKKIGKFQAVQHNLARLAGEAAAAGRNRRRMETGDLRTGL